MIQVNFKPPVSDPAWRDWTRRVRVARRALFEQFAEHPSKGIDKKLYKEMRDHFLDAFFDKCAYCELKLGAGQRRGDVDHYRPKGRVTSRAGELVYSADDRHQGYYWLAYSWRNLMPCCAACNRPATGPGGRLLGKWDRFPTHGDFWAKTPTELRRERPLLLNPYRDRPQEHFIFDSTGILGPRTERGRVTIEVLDLNRDALRDERKLAYDEASDAYRSLYQAYLSSNSQEEIVRRQRVVDDILKGRAAYSGFRREALNRAKAAFEDAQSSNPLKGPG